MNLNMSLKRGNLICAHADFAKFIYKTLDICSQRVFPFALRYTFPLSLFSYLLEFTEIIWNLT